jgi:hypothetical protein
MELDMSDSAYSAIIETRLRAIEAGQNAMNGALGLMLDTLHAQTVLLRELADYARDEPGPSPLVESLQKLSLAVVSMGESIDAMTHKIDALPREIVAGFDVDMGAAVDDRGDEGGEAC